MTTRLVEVRQQILKENDVVARALRRRFQEAGVYVVSLVSSPGSGKTEFLEATLRRLRQEFRVAALVGDLATENDAQRPGSRQCSGTPNHHGDGLSPGSQDGSGGLGGLGFG